MEIINTILRVLQIAFTTGAGIGIVVGFNEWRKGSKNNSGTQQDAGLEGIIMGVILLSVIAVVITYVRSQLASI